MHKNDGPLVSVVVITYNSSKFIYETLESIKKQSYNNIELIVSDDFSTDDTTDVVCCWVKENSSRFVNTKIIQSDRNTGIPSNCNRGISASSGQYVKIIAGDDLLLENCLALNVSFVNKNIGVKVLHSNAYKFYDSYLYQKQSHSKSKSCFNNPKINSKQQFNYLKFSWPVNASTLFFDKNVFEDIGLYDENLKIEDWPFLLKLSSKGIKIYFLDEFTTNYRIHDSSITRNQSGNKLANTYYKNQKQVVDIQLWGDLNWHERIYFQYKFFRFYFIINKTSNRGNNLLLKFIYLTMKIPDKTYEAIRKSLICFRISLSTFN